MFILKHFDENLIEIKKKNCEENNHNSHKNIRITTDKSSKKSSFDSIPSTKTTWKRKTKMIMRSTPLQLKKKKEKEAI